MLAKRLHSDADLYASAQPDGTFRQRKRTRREKGNRASSSEMTIQLVPIDPLYGIKCLIYYLVSDT